MKRSILFVLCALLAVGCGDSKPEPVVVPEPEPKPATAPDPKAKQPKPPSVAVNRAPAPPKQPIPPRRMFDARLTAYQVPPAWIETAQVDFDLTKPWADARTEVQRLFSRDETDSKRQAMKLAWHYQQKKAIADEREYPIYALLSGEKLWAIKAANSYLGQPALADPIPVFTFLARVYAQFGEFQRANQTLTLALTRLPASSANVLRQAEVHEAFGDVLAAQGNLTGAEKNYQRSVRLVPESQQAQAKLQSLADPARRQAALKDEAILNRAWRALQQAGP